MFTYAYLPPLRGQNLASSLRSLQGFQGLSESDLNTLHRRLKLARKQVQLAFECLKYQEAEREGQQQEDVATQFRLMVGDEQRAKQGAPWHRG